MISSLAIPRLCYSVEVSTEECEVFKLSATFTQSYMIDEKVNVTLGSFC